jgi:phosphatidylserine/phosphatidylglycerophosphate/cardiolipin synthase-like enzyme
VLARGGGSPLHDISVRIDGQAAADVADVFERRWKADRSRRWIPLPNRRPPTAAPPGTGPTVQIGVNYGCGSPLPDIRHAIRGGSELITNLFLNCRSFFYVEDQYGLGHDELAVAIRRAFENGARYGVVVLANAKGVEDMPEIDYWRHRFWSKFPQIGRSLFVFERVGDDGNPNGPHAYVHSKLVLVDDRAVSISSLNISRRSWYHDSEIGAVISDAPQRIANFRAALWSEHLTIGQDGLRDPTVAQVIWLNAYVGVGPRPRLNPLRYLVSKTPPPRKSAELLPSRSSTILAGLAGGLAGGLGVGFVRDTIDSVMDSAHWLIFDPRGRDSC